MSLGRCCPRNIVMSQIISHFVLSLIVSTGLATKRKYQSAETMKLRTACVNTVNTSGYSLQLRPFCHIVYLPLILLILKWNSQNHDGIKEHWVSWIMSKVSLFFLSLSYVALQHGKKPSCLTCFCILDLVWKVIARVAGGWGP